jgi:hypothetical protein
MRTAAIALGILAGLVILAFGALLFGIGFGQVQARIPAFWSFVFSAAGLAIAGGIASRWQATLGAVVMVGAGLVWLLLDQRLMQTLNLFGTARGTVSALVILLLPILLLGIAIYLSLRSQGTTRPPAE